MQSSIYEFEWSDLLREVGDLVGGLHSTTDDVAMKRARVDFEGSLEFALCELLPDGDRTRGFWCDGIEFDRWTVSSEAIEGSGTAWCGHTGQELMPIEARLSRCPAELSQITELEVRIGDGNTSGAGPPIREHYRHIAPLPTTWLAVFRVRQQPPIEPRSAVAQLEELLLDHTHTRIVGPDWEDLSAESAESLVAAQARLGNILKLESTWLDGERAVRVSWE